MRMALKEAERAYDEGEVPVGAVVVIDGKIVSRGYNMVEKLNDPTAHAEMMALRKAGSALKNYRLCDATIYVTLEPCVMCMGAISHARIKRLVFGAFDPKRGAVCHALSLTDASFLNHRIGWVGGVLGRECSELLKDFFRAKR